MIVYNWFLLIKRILWQTYSLKRHWYPDFSKPHSYCLQYFSPRVQAFGNCQQECRSEWEREYSCYMQSQTEAVFEAILVEGWQESSSKCNDYIRSQIMVCCKICNADRKCHQKRYWKLYLYWKRCARSHCINICNCYSQKWVQCYSYCTFCSRVLCGKGDAYRYLDLIETPLPFIKFTIAPCRK